METGSIEDLAVDATGALYVLARNHVVKYRITLPAKK